MIYAEAVPVSAAFAGAAAPYVTHRCGISCPHRACKHALLACMSLECKSCIPNTQIGVCSWGAQYNSLHSSPEYIESMDGRIHGVMLHTTPLLWVYSGEAVQWICNVLLTELCCSILSKPSPTAQVDTSC